jgi:hypothetical protein
MLLPFVAWAVTGVFFFVKPGYKEAYASLPIIAYPLIAKDQLKVTLPNTSQWLEFRQIRTVLGPHLLVRNRDGWQQLNPWSFETLPKPNAEQVRALVKDAIAIDPTRYGDIQSVNELSALTTHDIRISLNWEQLTLVQQGTDTDFINSMYDIHYLRWTGYQKIDQILGVVGLSFVIILAFLGVFMFFQQKKITDKPM